MRPDKRTKVRLPIGAQLIQGEDDDLIRWYKSLAPKTGQATIKRLLRLALDMPQPEAPTPVDMLIAHNGEVDALQNRIGQLEAWIEKIANDLPGYVQTEIRKSLVNGAPLPPPQIEGGARLEESALEKREKRMKSSNW